MSINLCITTRSWFTSKVSAHLSPVATPWLLFDSVPLFPSIEFSFPHLPKFFPINRPSQFLYSLMIITAYREKSHFTCILGTRNYSIWSLKLEKDIVGFPPPDSYRVTSISVNVEKQERNSPLSFNVVSLYSATECMTSSAIWFSHSVTTGNNQWCPWPVQFCGLRKHFGQPFIGIY